MPPDRCRRHPQKLCEWDDGLLVRGAALLDGPDRTRLLGLVVAREGLPGDPLGLLLAVRGGDLQAALDLVLDLLRGWSLASSLRCSVAAGPAPARVGHAARLLGRRDRNSDTGWPASRSLARWCCPSVRSRAARRRSTAASASSTAARPAPTRRRSGSTSCRSPRPRSTAARSCARCTTRRSSRLSGPGASSAGRGRRRSCPSGSLPPRHPPGSLRGRRAPARSP